MDASAALLTTSDSGSAAEIIDEKAVQRGA
jgi:hypothetical protein